MYKFLNIKKATDGKHKYEVELMNEETKRKKTIKFGSEGAGDYIIFTKKEGKKVADEHKERYIQRHQKREDWTKTGVTTAGWWAKHVLWNKGTFEASLKDALKLM